MQILIPSDKYKLSDGIFVYKIEVLFLAFYIKFRCEFISAASSFVTSKNFNVVLKNTVYGALVAVNGVFARTSTRMF